MLKRALSILANKWYSLSRKGSIFLNESKLIDWHFPFFDFSIGGVYHNIIFWSFMKNFIFRFVELSHLSSFLIFSFYNTNLHHGQGNWSFFKYSWSKLSIPTLKKPVYHLRLLIHHLQVIWHTHPSHLNLMIKTLIKTRTTTTTQIQIKSTHV